MIIIMVKMKKPNLFIVGEPKSGTTALHYFLSQHPDIFMSEPKEPHYFEKDFQEEGRHLKGNMRHFKYLDEKHYLSLFEEVKDEKIIGESSTDYLYSKVAAKEIFRFNPDAKIIIILREPVEFLYSLHSQYLYQSCENETDFQKAFNLESRRRNNEEKIPKNAPYPSYLFYSERIKYAAQIKRYLELFPSKNIKIIFYDEFRKDNPGIYKKVLAFLGVDDSFIPDFRQLNVNKRARFTVIKDLIEKSYVWRIIKKILPDKVYIKISDLYHSIFLVKTKRQPLNKEFKRNLMTRFRPEVAKVSKTINFNLKDKWGY